MFTTIFWTVVMLLLIGAVFAGMKLFESHGFVMSDLALFILPFVAWLTLTLTGMRPKSLANLVEPIVLVPAVLVAFLVRAFAFQAHPDRVRSSWAAGLCIVAAVILYAFVPVLEE